MVTILLFASSGIGKEVAKMQGLKISSPAFMEKGHIPEKYTCDGKNISPPLSIENVPSNSKSLALIVDDPDAPVGTWVHWVVWNVPPDTKEIKENFVPPKAEQGLNDFGRRNYGGPCPPSGTHRYFFKIYALDAVLGLGPNSTKADLEKSMRGRIIGQAQIIGLYQKR